MANEEIQELQDLSSADIKDKASNLFESNKNLIYGAIAAIVFIAGGILWYNSNQATQNAKANNEIFKADQMMDRDSFSLALNGRNVAGAANNFLGYKSVISKYRGTDAANLAHYKAGVANLNLGQFAVALEFLKNYSGPEELQTQAYNLMGDASSSLQKMDEALSYHQKASNYTDNISLVVYSLYKCAKILEKKGDMEAARKYYTQIVEKDKKLAIDLGVEKDLIRLAQ